MPLKILNLGLGVIQISRAKGVTSHDEPQRLISQYQT